MSVTTTPAPTSRRSLAGELDRLDSILDGLSDNLHQAVADAVRQALAQQLRPAVQHELQAALAERPVVGPSRIDQAGPAQPGWLVRAAGQIESWAAAGVVALRRTKVWVRDRGDAARLAWRQAGEKLQQLWAALVALLPLLWLLRWHVLTAWVAGAGLALLTYLAGPVLALVVAGLAGSVLTFLALLRLLPRPLAAQRVQPRE